MGVNYKALEHEAVNLVRKRAKVPPTLSYKKQLAMLDDIFKGLVPYILEGFIIKAPHNIGEFCLGVSKNYKFSNPLDIHHKFDWVKTRHDPEGKYHLRTYSKKQYYLFWTPGERKELMNYFFCHSDSFNQKLHQRIVEGGKLFAYSKQYPGLVKELSNRRFKKYKKKKNTK